MIDKFIRLVKSQIEHYEAQVARYPPENPNHRPGQVAMYKRLIQEHSELLEHLESRAAGLGSTAQDSEQLSRTGDEEPEDLSGLPEELLKQLSESVTKDSTDPLIEIIKDRGGSANLDEVLIDLYRKHSEIAKRTQISNRLFRLAKRKRIWKVPGRKGVYTTTPPSTTKGKGEAEILDISRAREKK